MFIYAFINLSIQCRLANILDIVSKMSLYSICTISFTFSLIHLRKT